MRVVSGPAGPVAITRDGEKLNFCSNDYLGLAAHPSIKRAFSEGVERWGAGTGASRLISGNTEIHEQLEEALADFMKSEEAVLFPSGYQANVGAITALTERGDNIFSDELVHASVVDGARLSRADIRVFEHREAGHLAERLALEDRRGLRLVITDSVFSMDGDLAPLERIVEVAEEADALCYVDEAHALGVLGPSGRGLVAAEGLEDRVAVRVGTFGKAFGVSGAFVACDRDAAAVIRSRARSLLYTTGAPAPIAEAVLASLRILARAEEARAALRRNIESFKDEAGRHGIDLAGSETPIQPIMIGPALKTMEVSAELWKRGFFVQGIRPPTVREGTSRLRVTLTAAHTAEQIRSFVRVLSEVLPQPSSTYLPPSSNFNSSRTPPSVED